MNSFDSNNSLKEIQSWRQYQSTLRKQKTTVTRKIFVFLFKFGLLLAFIYICFSIFSLPHRKTVVSIPNTKPKKIISQKPTFKKHYTKKEINILLRELPPKKIDNANFTIISNGRKLYFETSIDSLLQNFITEKFRQYKPSDRGKPEKVGIVVMDPATGSIIAMTGINDSGISTLMCATERYPAASIFKIVTAAAAIEKINLKAETKLKYNGGKYTLYKRQLKEKNNKYTNEITFKNAFAQSVNPIFGKLGYNTLKEDNLSQYAEAFFFNKDIEFEFEFDSGIVNISKEPYHWAEIACGFNRKTKISPLFGALIGAVIVNNGIMMEPTIIKEVKDKEGTQLYVSKKAVVNRVIKTATAQEIKKLMHATITSGTGKKSFRGYNKDSILSKLNIGGKTGSIFNTARDIKFDWFVGFAEEQKKDSKNLAIAVVVGHGKYIGRRASQYGRMIMKKYYTELYKKRKKFVKSL